MRWIMKQMLKIMAISGAVAAIGGGVYLMQNKNARKKTGKTMLKAMDSAEAMIAKKMN